MKCTVAVIARDIQRDKYGLVIGRMSACIFSNKFPLEIPLKIALQLRCDPEEMSNTHSMRTTVIDPDGKTLFDETRPTVAPKFDDGKYGYINDILIFSDFLVTSAGHYRFDIYINGNHVADVMFYARRGTA